jgi:hypothetical protein
VLLNDPTFVESARAFAGRILRDGGATPDDRLRWAWRTALSREPTSRELSALRSLLDHDLSEFQSDRVAAEKLLKAGPVPADNDRIELAAWTSVARAIFNLNEFISKN